MTIRFCCCGKAQSKVLEINKLNRKIMNVCCISCSDILVVTVSILLIGAIKVCLKSSKPIQHIYRRPNGFFWLKVAFMYTVLTSRQLYARFLRKKKELTDGNKALIKLDEELYFKLDTYQKLSYHEQAIDAVYFNCANQSGDYLVVGTARRKNRLVDGFLYLKLNVTGLGVLESPKLPATDLYQTEDSVVEYGAEGIKVAPVSPMRRWKITYDGKMKQFTDRTNSNINVKIDAEWTSTLPVFNFDTDMDAFLMAKSMAYETWSRDYFTMLQMNHQTHYEQYGDVKGTATIDGRRYDISLNGLRDHSFGLRRDWRQFHRYGLHFLSLENGDRITVGSICMPVSFSRLTIGYVYSAADKKIHPVDECDLQLYQHGENGVPPLDYAFSFHAGRRTYTMEVNVIDSPYFYISRDWESKVIERLCTFVVNGVKGWGAAEWVYRNIDGRNVEDIK